MASPPTIFVQIASYRDPETQWTVKDLFEKAEHPDQVTVGICWQYDPETDMDCFVVPSPRPTQTKVVSALPWESEGVCWARALTQTLFEDQDYVLMIDSHMRFIQNWDTELIAELKRCGSAKPFLSTYPPGYKPPNNLEQNPRPVVMRSKPFDEFGDIRFEGEYLNGTPPEKPLPGAFLAAGLLFAPGRFVRDVPYDPRMYFSHEEITLAARAYTHGWDVFSPVRTFIYHYYHEPKKGETRALHWQDRKDWDRLRTLSRQRYNYLLAGIPAENSEALQEIEKYGLGSVRSLTEYEAFSGLDFKKKIASDRARKSEFVKGLDAYRRPPAKAAAAPQPTLREGISLPPIVLKDAAGAIKDISVLNGKPFIMCTLPAAFDAFVREFMELYNARRANFDEKGIPLLIVAPVPAQELGGFCERNGIRGILADESGLLHRSFGHEQRLHDMPVSVALDGGRIVRGVYNNRSAHNHMGELVRAAATLAAAPATAGKEDLSVFAKIAETNSWGNKESKSGPGSTLAATTSLRKGLGEVLQKLNIRTFVDAPCGDMNWMRQFQYPFEKFIGIDIVPGIIEKLRTENFPPQYHFQVGNIVTDILPAADAVFCRDCLVHLPFGLILEARRLWKSAGFKFVFATTFPNTETNTDCKPGEWRRLNMAIAPFDWSTPQLIIPDADGLGPPSNSKSIGVWQL